MLKRIYLFGVVNLAAFSLSVAHAEQCKLQENCDCKTPGITLRWEYAYCMFKLGISDVEAEMGKVDKCAQSAKPKDYGKLSPCEKNQFWRKKTCLLNRAYFKSEKECMTSDKGIPNFIENGP